jgi:hypothetical protein
MKRFLLYALFLLLNTLMAQGQGTVRGKVTDAVTGEGLLASVAVKNAQPAVSTSTDLDGNYSLSIKQAGQLTIAVSFFGYATKEAIIDPKNGEVIVLNFELREEGEVLKEFEVVGQGSKRTDVYLDRMKVNAAVSFDYISRDAIQRTGDADAAQAVKRVTGVSTVGAFVTVRGLADRYLVTTVNGARIPTLDPLTNNLRLDIFPTGLMDNIIITKTATPDMPADWAGAYISLNTSDYPQRLQISVSTNIGFNTNSTGQDIVTSKRSSTDWLGFDDGLRAIPDGVSSDVESYPEFIEPDLYQQLGLLGLSGYLNSFGITNSTPGFGSTTMSTSNTLSHLALTELGLLAPALLYDGTAVQTAVNNYNSTYNLAYFSPTLNAGLAEVNTKFNNENWRVSTAQGIPNFSQSFSIGNQVQLFKKGKTQRTLGYLFGFRYNTETENDPNSVQQRSGESYDTPTPGLNYGQQGTQQITVETSGWSAVGNLSFRLDRNNSFSLMVMPNRIGQNNARFQEFLNPGLGSTAFISEDQYYEQRQIWVYQYGSKHLIPALNMTVEADVSYSDGERELLDLRTLQYIKEDGGSDGALTQPGRTYRFMDEELLDARLGLEVPLGEQRPGIVRKLKFGGSYRYNERQNTQAYFRVQGAPGPTGWTDPGRFEMRPDGRFTSYYFPFGTFKDNDIGILKVAAGFLMSDYAVNSRLRVIGGLRAEYTDLLTDILRFHEQGIAADDPSRGTVGDVSAGGSASAEPQPARPGTIEQWDVLPSVNLIYRLVADEEAPTNLRLSYFRSLARPSFREFSVVQLFDYLLSAPVYGNPDLQMTNIDNYDVRVERFFKNRNSVSLSGFYKHFKNHIELLFTAAGGYTWRNAIESDVLGAELEGKVNLNKNFEVRGNLTLMSSKSVLANTFGNGSDTYSTRMFGQAPWIVNTMFTYAPADSSGFSASLSYNVQGPKLAITNSEVNPSGIRAYEMPRHMLDLMVNQRLGKHWSLTGRVRNLLNSPLRRSYLFASGYDYDFDSYAWGTEYSLGFSYTIK